MFPRRLSQLARRQGLRATAWVLVPVLFIAGVPRQACECSAAQTQEHCVRAVAPARPAPHSCCQQKEPASPVSHGGNCQWAAPAQACCCHTLPSITAFTLPSKAGESTQSVHQSADLGTNFFVSVEAESHPVLSSARLFGPPPDDLVVALRRFLI